jgi:1-acyl-sn-glycerol-3-phosphate acyltransferase
MSGHCRALGRLLRLLGHILGGAITVRTRLPALTADQRALVVEQWAQGFLARAGVGLRIQGQPSLQGPLLLVANHQSWLDIPTLHAGRACRFVSKAEIGHWPIVGGLAKAAGTLFIQRGSRRDTQRIVQAMVTALQQGDMLCVFPEGTVGPGSQLLPFHGNMLQAAIDADVPVQPVALSFVDIRTGQPSYLPCESYLDEPMLRSLWRTLKSEHLVAVVHYGTPEKAGGRDRRTWARDLQAQVQALRAVPVAAQ